VVHLNFRYYSFGLESMWRSDPWHRFLSYCK